MKKTWWPLATTMLKTMKQPKLTLVGAGPGDPDLISLKGIKAIAAADVVLFDALVHPDLLKFATGEKIYVGKRAGQPSKTQDEINQLIVDRALSKGHVVRLKGGDPFIFGRGLEEKEYAEIFNIEVEVVPGISSSTGLPGLEGVSLTQRGINHGFWVLTATASDGGLTSEFTEAARSNATVVALMGVRKLEQLTRIYTELGKEELPVLIIQNGSLPYQRSFLGTVANINNKFRDYVEDGPGIIVFGETVRSHPEFVTEQAKTYLNNNYYQN